MLSSTTRPLCCCIRREKGFKMYLKDSGWDNRGSCSPAAAALLLARQSGAPRLLMEKSFRFQKDFFPPFYSTRSRQRQTQHTSVCACICSMCVYCKILNPIWTKSSVCVSWSYSGHQWRVARSVLIPTWSRHSLSDSSAELCVCLSVNSLQTWRKKSHMELLYHTVKNPPVSPICLFIQCSHWAAYFIKHRLNVHPSHSETNPRSVDTTPGSDGVGVYV